MDMTRYEKIDIETATGLLTAGQVVYRVCGAQYKLGVNGKLKSKFQGQNSFRDDLSVVGWFLQQDWYIKKPFDVRQAMRDKPDEWVGAFFDEDSESWRKVGFDFKNFKAVEVCIKDDVVTDFYKYGVFGALQEELDACIPLDEVPADAR